MRRWLRRLLWFGLAFAALLAGAVAAAPSLLSTDGGRDWLMGRVNRAIPGRLASDSIALGWGSGQTMKGLRLADPGGEVVVRCREARTDFSLWKLVRGAFGPGQVTLVGLELDLVVDDDGRLNLGSAVAAPGDEPARPLEDVLREFELQLPGSVDVVVALEDSRVSFRAAGLEPIALEGVTGRLEVAAGRPVALRLEGRLGGAAPARLEAKLDGLGESGVLRARDLGLQVSLDASWDLDHPYVEHLRMLCGDSARVTVGVKTKPDEIALDLSLDSPRATAGGGARAMLGEERAVVLTRPLTATAAVEDERAGTVPVTLTVREARLPLDDFDPAVSSLHGTAAIGDGSVTIQGETFAWRGWKGSFAKSRDEKTGRFELGGAIADGTLRIDGRAGETVEELSAKAERLPLAPIDRIARAFGVPESLLVDALGPRLDMTATVTPADGAYDADLRVTTERLAVRAPVRYEDGTLSGRDVTIAGTIAPVLLGRFSTEEAIAVSLRVASFSAPVLEFDPARLQVEAHAEVSDFVADVKLAGDLAVSAKGRGVAVDGTLRGLFGDDGAFRPGRATGTLTATLDRVSLKDLGRLSGIDLAKYAGPALGGRVVVKGDGRQATVDVTLRAQRVSAELPLVLADDRVRLRAPGEIRATVTPALAPGLGANVPLACRLEEFGMPLGKPAPADVRAVGKITAGEFSFTRDGRKIVVDRLAVAFRGDSVASAHAELEAWVVADERLGAPLSVEVRGDLAELRPVRVDAKLGSDVLELDVGARREGGRYVLARPLTGSYRLAHAQLEKPVSITLLVPELSVPESLDWRGIRGRAELKAPLLAFRQENAPPIRDWVVSLSLGEDLDVRARAEGVDVTAQVRSWAQGETAPATVKAVLKDVPTALAAPFTELDVPLLVGERADVTLDADLPKGRNLEEAGHVDVTVKAPRLQADARVAAPASLARPATARWTMTPAAARALGLDESLDLAAPATVDLRVERLVRVEKKLAVTARGSCGTLRLAQRREDLLAVENLRFDLSSEDLGDSFTANLRGNLAGAAADSLKASLAVERHGAADWRRASVRADVDAASVPVEPLDRLLKAEGQLHAVLGDAATVNATSRLARGAGPIDLELKSKNLSATIVARATPDAFTLREPVTAELAHSERLAKIVLPKLGPFFDGIAKTEAPIRLRVESRGFSVLRPYSLDGVALPSATLDVGKVVLENQALVDAIKKLAKVGVPDRTSAWFTPLEIGMRNGKISYGRRLDVLFDDNLRLATWGEVDLAANRLDMALVIMPQTVRKLLGIGDGTTDTLQVPIRGPLDRPRIEVARAVADVAAIKAKEEALKNAPPLVKAIADRALKELLRKSLGGLPPKEASVDPLPWDRPQR